MSQTVFNKHLNLFDNAAGNLVNMTSQQPQQGTATMTI